MKVKEQTWVRQPDGTDAKEMVSFEVPPVGSLVRLDSFNVQWVQFFGREMFGCDTYLPTEAIVRGTSVPDCRRGRVFRTGFFLFKGLVVSYDWLVQLCIKIGDPFPGSYAFESVVMVEVYADHGDDGHVDYRLIGYRFVGEKTLEERERPGWSGMGMMSCMREGWADND